MPLKLFLLSLVSTVKSDCEGRTYSVDPHRYQFGIEGEITCDVTITLCDNKRGQYYATASIPMLGIEGSRSDLGALKNQVEALAVSKLFGGDSDHGYKQLSSGCNCLDDETTTLGQCTLIIKTCFSLKVWEDVVLSDTSLSRSKYWYGTRISRGGYVRSISYDYDRTKSRSNALNTFQSSDYAASCPKPTRRPTRPTSSPTGPPSASADTSSPTGPPSASADTSQSVVTVPIKILVPAIFCCIVIMLFVCFYCIQKRKSRIREEQCGLVNEGVDGNEGAEYMHLLNGLQSYDAVIAENEGTQYL
eukprot:117991_1